MTFPDYFLHFHTNDRVKCYIITNYRMNCVNKSFFLSFFFCGLHTQLEGYAMSCHAMSYHLHFYLPCQILSNYTDACAQNYTKSKSAI